ncbi:hypothetical protein HYY74_01535 [Candidatus Woesearchaeota archaeon]|nr:hypothetical protein [Candidatus Woesearchaeota archaeon]
MKKALLVLAIFLIALIAGCSNTNTDIADEDRSKLVIFRDAGCGCCGQYAAYAREKGFDVDVRTVGSMNAIKMQYKVPGEMQSCHTSVIEGYFVEGHVPAEAIRKLLDERPDIAGIALPGMPMGSPGMTGSKSGQFIIHAIGKDGGTSEFMRI